MMISLVFKLKKKSTEVDGDISKEMRFFLTASSWLRVNSNALQDSMPNNMIKLKAGFH